MKSAIFISIIFIFTIAFSANAADIMEEMIEGENPSSAEETFPLPETTPEIIPPDSEPATAPVPAAPLTSAPVPATPPVSTPAHKPAPAPPSPEKKEGFVLLNFDEAELKDIISLVSEATGTNFIISPGITAKITIHSSKKIPSSELFSIFESILEMNGLAAVKSGNFYKIVQGPMAHQKALEVKKGKEISSIPAEDKIITQLIPLDFLPASEAITLLQPMISPMGVITPNTRNNILIITDVASNIRRFVEILKEVDVSAFESTKIRLFAPINVDVKTLSKELTDILNALTLGREGISLIPIERINKLVIFSPSEKFLQTIEDWAKKLDEETSPSGLTTYVYPIQNVKAKEIAEVLKAVYETKEGIKPAVPGTAPVTPKPATPAATPPKPGTPPARTLAPVSSPARKAETTEVRGMGDIKIVVYEPTNSLVIMASAGDYRQIVDTIKKLDIYPQQVLIEVLIAEVSLTDATRFGIQWSLLSQDRAKVLGETHSFEGLSQFRPGESLYSKQESPLPPIISGGLTPAVGGYSYLLYEAGRLTGMLHALATEGRVNVLSSPHLLVKDNQEASIDVGQEIPVATGTTQQTTAAEAPVVQNIQYKTVGVKLKMKPVINAEKTVVLDLTQEVSEYSADVTVGKEGFTYPAFSKREAKTAIIVSNGQSIIIGGIMKEMKKRGYEGIPFLSKIPLLGYLFRYTTSNIDKTELIILLTPHVISSKSEADIITQEFKDRVKDLKKPLRGLEKEKEEREKEKREREEEEQRKKENPMEEYPIPG